VARSENGDVRKDIRPPLARHRLWRHGVRPRLVHGSETVRISGNARPITTKPWREPTIQKALLGSSSRDRSTNIYGAVVAAVNAGWSRQETRNLLSANGCAVAADFAGRVDDHGEKVTEKWFEDHVWPSATKWVKENPVRRQEPDPLLARLSAEVEHLPWPPRSGSSDRAVYIAMIQKATTVGELTFNASQRDLMRGQVWHRA
jgi:hypothetical protein